MDDTLEINARLLKAAFTELVPFEPADQEKVETSRRFLAELLREIRATDPIDDHSVGLCACSTFRMIDELHALLKPCG